jgi:hypothetical protein
VWFGYTTSLKVFARQRGELIHKAQNMVVLAIPTLQLAMG